MSWDMQSCDTLGVCASHSRVRSNMMAKNSDRPIAEAQPLVWFPAAVHASGEKLDCSGFVIPQAPRTYGVLGSKPYWIWGFEMGVNDRGVVIGNEAEYSRDFGKEKDEGLLGMDLLRLGLERGATAREALDVIVELLERYGQNHNANALHDARYENSFLIMDPREIWALETAGRRYAAKRVSAYHAVGNTYSIGENIDLASPDLEAHARENGWLMPYDRFDFAKAYSAPIPNLTLSTPRRRRVMQLAGMTEEHDFDTLKRIFRDHYEGELCAPRFGASSGVFPTVCRHALNVDASQTAASMLVRYREGIGPVIRQAYSQPCCSVYLPAYVGLDMPEAMSRGDGAFDEKSLWWLTDRLNKIVALDYDRYAPAVHEAIRALEEWIETRAAEAEDKAAALVQKGDDEGSRKILAALMEECSAAAVTLTKEQFERIRGDLRAHGVSGIMGPHRDFLQKYSDLAKMPLL